MEELFGDIANGILNTTTQLSWEIAVNDRHLLNLIHEVVNSNPAHSSMILL